MQPDLYLMSLALAPSYRGFRYLCTALELLERDPDLLTYSCKWLYPEICKRHPGSSVTKIERSIRTALHVIWLHNSADRLAFLFRHPLAEKPKPKQFLAYLFADYRLGS